MKEKGEREREYSKYICSLINSLGVVELSSHIVLLCAGLPLMVFCSTSGKSSYCYILVAYLLISK
jgi:hypothetical protein